MKRILLMMMAAFAMVVACGNPDDAPVSGNGDLTLEADKLEIVADGEDSAELTVKYSGKSVTDGVGFYDAITNIPVGVKEMRFFTRIAASHKIYATYKGKKSNTLTIKALEYAVPAVPEDTDPSGKAFRKRVLLTQFTSTGCTYCPIVVSLLRELSADASYADKYVLAASHADMPGYQNGIDPAAFPGVTGFMSAFGILGFPTLLADFNDALGGYDLSKLKALVGGCYGDGTAAAGIAASSLRADKAIVVRAAVKAGQTGSYRIGAWLLEDGIYGKQTSAPNESFNTHNNCIRALDAGSTYMGHSVGKLASGTVNEHIFTFKNLDPEWKLENCKVLLYVTSSVGNMQMVDNAVIVPIGGTVGFEYK